jgi:hypothetical protein
MESPKDKILVKSGRPLASACRRRTEAEILPKFSSRDMMRRGQQIQFFYFGFFSFQDWTALFFGNT